jgi:hypothetical protein
MAIAPSLPSVPKEASHGEKLVRRRVASAPASRTTGSGSTLVPLRSGAMDVWKMSTRRNGAAVDARRRQCGRNRPMSGASITEARTVSGLCRQPAAHPGWLRLRCDPLGNSPAAPAIICTSTARSEYAVSIAATNSNTSASLPTHHRSLVSAISQFWPTSASSPTRQ